MIVVRSFVIGLSSRASSTSTSAVISSPGRTGARKRQFTSRKTLPGPGSVFLHVEWDFKAPVRPDDVITAEVEVLEAREDKPLTRLRTTIANQDGTVVLDGTALVWTEALAT